MHVSELLRLAGAVGRPEPAKAAAVHLLLQGMTRVGVKDVQILLSLAILNSDYCNVLV